MFFWRLQDWLWRRLNNLLDKFQRNPCEIDDIEKFVEMVRSNHCAWVHGELVSRVNDREDGLDVYAKLSATIDVVYREWLGHIQSAPGDVIKKDTADHIEATRVFLGLYVLLEEIRKDLPASVIVTMIDEEGEGYTQEKIDELMAEVKRYGLLSED